MTAREVISQFIEGVLFLNGSNAVLCVDLYTPETGTQEYEKQYSLPMGHTQDRFNAFLEALNFGLPCPEDLWGVIWFQDGSWARPVTEVDEAGNVLSHDWVHYARPEIPAWLNVQ
jgi:hypothetical protein